MKFPSAILLAVLWMITGASAQWVKKSYSLVSGWNGVWLAGDATYTDVKTLFAGTAVTEVWRWNPNPDQINFVSTPSQPTTNSDEWTVWKLDGSETQLTRMVGNSSYLIKCSAATTVNMEQLVLPPAATWLISGANFLGFPASSTGPLMSSYLASYPSAATTVLSTPSKVYKYIGGELGSTNPMQVATGAEKMDSGKAYWFNVATVGNFTAPVEYEVASSAGLAFGRTLSSMTVGVTNRSSTALTLTFSLESSAPAPQNQQAITGGVPLTRRVFDSGTNSYQETALGTFAVSVPANGRLNVDFGINRAAMTGSSSAYYASILRVKDSANLTDVTLPVSAQTSTSAGLWACQVKVTNVASTISGSGSTTSQPFPLLFLVHQDSSGIARILSQAYVGRLTSAGNPMGITLKEANVLAYGASDVDPHRYFAAQMPLTPYIAGTVSPSPPAGGDSMRTDATVTYGISIPYKDVTNPFVHTYHPDHDNLSANFKSTLDAGVESYSIARSCAFTFTAAPPDGSTVQGWGTTVLGGTYHETLSGLNKQPLTVFGTFSMRRISEISTIDLGF